MRKTLKWTFIATLLIGIIIVLVIKPRGYKRMEKLANLKFKSILLHSDPNIDRNDFQRIPLRENTDKGVLIFPWICVLESGDTAMISIEVRKKVYPWEYENFVVRKNKKWGYLSDPESTFKQVLPNKYKNDYNYLENVSLYRYQNDLFVDVDSLKLIISPDKMYSFLKDGYFNVLLRENEYTVVAFYEPIAFIRKENKIIATKTAKIYFNENAEMLIIPYDAPRELWDNYNKE